MSEKEPPSIAQAHTGLEWTDALAAEIVENVDTLECFELIPENFFDGQRAHVLAALGEAGIPVLIHAVELSLGTDAPLKALHLDRILRVADRVNAVNLSDHLCFTEAGGVEIGQLTPLVSTREAADVVCRKIEQIQKRTNLPFLIENVAHRFLMPEPELSETELIRLVQERTGCSLLLDLHNLHANATNFGIDAIEWLSELDLTRVGAIHLAGGYWDEDNFLVDGHNHAVPDASWALYARVCRRIRPAYTIVEWTDDVPSFQAVLAEIGKARVCLSSRRADLTLAPESVGAKASEKELRR